MGCAFALVFAAMGSAYGTAKSGVGVAAMGVLKPDLINKGMIPVVMAGIVGIYGLIVAVMIEQNSAVVACARAASAARCMCCCCLA